MIRCNSGWCHDHFRAERLEQTHLFLRHLVGQREDALVTAQRSGDSETHTGVAARPLDDRSARLELSLTFRTLDDRKPDAILDRSTRIEEFSLAIHRRPDAARDAVQPDQRRPPDRLENVVVWPLVSFY